MKSYPPGAFSTENSPPYAVPSDSARIRRLETRSNLTNVRSFGFLDTEINESLYTFYNESSALVNVTGTGSADTAADSREKV